MKIFLIIGLLLPLLVSGQGKVISGPMLGPVELRAAKIWVEVSPEVKQAAVQYFKQGETRKKVIYYEGELGNDFNPVVFTIGGLDFDTKYDYEILINGKSSG